MLSHYTVYLFFPITSCCLCPNIFLSTIFSKSLNIRHSFTVKYQVPQPHKMPTLLFPILIFANFFQHDRCISPSTLLRGPASLLATVEFCKPMASASEAAQFGPAVTCVVGLLCYLPALDYGCVTEVPSAAVFHRGS